MQRFGVAGCFAENMQGGGEKKKMPRMIRAFPPAWCRKQCRATRRRTSESSSAAEARRTRELLMRIRGISTVLIIRARVTWAGAAAVGVAVCAAHA